MSSDEKCCGNGCASAPDELKRMVMLVTQLSSQYTQAIAGNKKKTTEARKSLLEIKKLSGDMRKMVFEKNKAARAAKVEKKP